MQRSLVYFLFTASGFAALIYQPVLVRQVGNTFGHTVFAASLVSALYMLGLGLGALWGGKWADDLHKTGERRVLQAYAACELLIAIWALLLQSILPHLDTLAAYFLQYKEGAYGWHFPHPLTSSLQYVFLALLILPGTFLMGATLPLLIRYFSKLSNIGASIAKLYALNTLGAALGALAIDFIFIPNLGISRSVLVAVALNIIIALLVYLKFGFERIQLPKFQLPLANFLPKKIAPLLFAVAFMGALGMAAEIFWFRYFVTGLIASRAVFAFVLFLVLSGIALGSYFAKILLSRNLSAGNLFIYSNIAFYSSFVLLILIYPLKSFGYIDYNLNGTLLELILLVKVTLIPILIPAIFLGFSFPCANKIAQTEESQIGEYAGLVYLYNTLGGTIGALLMGFVFIPKLSQYYAILILALFSLAVSFLLYRQLKVELKKQWLAHCVVFSLVLCWLSVGDNFLVKKTFAHLIRQGGQLLAYSEGINENIMIRRTQGYTVLFTNGHNMSDTQHPSQRYMKSFVHLPMLYLDNPLQMTLICYGVGNTLNAMTKYPSLEKISVVDLSENVLRHAPYFGAENFRSFLNPRVQKYVNDGRLHLLHSIAADQDLITLEPPPIALAGVSTLYSKDFYQLARSRLRDGGFFTQWLPIQQLNADGILASVRAFIDVFPESILVSGERAQFILIGRKNASIKITKAEIERRLGNRPQVLAEMRKLLLGNTNSIIGSFVADFKRMDKVTSGVKPLSDDWPATEYNFLVSNQSLKPAELLAPQDYASWCPDCKTKSLDQYSHILQQIYHSQQFLRNGMDKGNLSSVNIEIGKAEIEKLWREIPYLNQLIPMAIMQKTQ